VAPIAPVAPSSQFHAQDEFGQFSFGYQNINSARTESKDAFGVTRGSYQYVDANGVLQTVNYISDDVNGFRVAATNVPVAPSAPAVAPVAPAAVPLVAPVAPAETPEVAAARAEHLAAHAAATSAAASIEKREAEPIEATYGIPSAPVLSLPVPIVHNAPAPVLNHIVHTIPAPVAPAPVAALPPTFNDFRNFVPVNQVFAPEQFAFVAAPSPVPAPIAPTPLAASPVALPSPAPFAAAPVALPASVPLAAAPAPVAAPVPVAPIAPVAPSSQFHAQDEFGQFSFGYQNINSARTESKDAFGVTRGSYQYVDANGVLQTVNYISDDVNGFRVAATNVPVAPSAPAAAPLVAPVAPIAPEVAPLVAPVAPAETPEVAAARAEHLAAHEKAKAAATAADAEA